jgi:3-methylcrotonyl-CoA carboxylase beta subunit
MANEKLNVEFNRNEDHLKLQVGEFKHKLKKIKLGGGEKRIEDQHKQGKMTARERVDYLIDKDSQFIEIGAFAVMECTKNTVAVLPVVL